MGYIFHLLVALATIAALDFELVQPATLGFTVPFLAILPAGLGRMAREALLRGHFRLAERCERLLALSPVVVQAIGVLGLGWCGWLEERFGLRVTLEGWPGPELLLGLVPFLLGQIAAIDARARLQDSRPDEIASVRSFQLRLLLSSLVPLGFFIALSTAIRSNEWVMVHVEEVDLVNGVMSASLLALLVVALPGLLRRTWSTRPLPAGMQRDLLEAVARLADFRCKEILIWQTAGQMANAAIVGFTPRSRLVLFTDALLAHLGPRELAGVFAHEMGHARKRHALVFGAYAIAMFLGVDLILRDVELESETALIASALGVLVLWYVSFGYLSRRFELEADLESLEVLGDPAALVQALHAVAGPRARKRKSWRHFSTEKRIAFLQSLRVSHKPAVRLRRVLAGWRVAIYASFFVVLALQIQAMLGSWNTDRAWANLRLGRYEKAAELAAGSEEEKLVPLGELALSVPFEERRPELFLDRARAALERDEFDLAEDWIRLALLRAPNEAALRVLIWLDGSREEPLPFDDLEGFEAQTEPWREALR